MARAPFSLTFPSRASTLFSIRTRSFSPLSLCLSLILWNLVPFPILFLGYSSTIQCYYQFYQLLPSVPFPVLPGLSLCLCVFHVFSWDLPLPEELFGCNSSATFVSFQSLGFLVPLAEPNYDCEMVMGIWRIALCTEKFLAVELDSIFGSFLWKEATHAFTSIFFEDFKFRNWKVDYFHSYCLYFLPVHGWSSYDSPFALEASITVKADLGYHPFAWNAICLVSLVLSLCQRIWGYSKYFHSLTNWVKYFQSWPFDSNQQMSLSRPLSICFLEKEYGFYFDLKLWCTLSRRVSFCLFQLHQFWFAFLVDLRDLQLFSFLLDL